MTNFMDALQASKHTLDSAQGGNSAEFDALKTKNKKLYFDKNHPEYLVRILPSRKAIEGTLTENDMPLGPLFRTLYVNYRTDKGNDGHTSLTLAPRQDMNSPLEQNVAKWLDEGTLDVPGARYKTKAVTRAYLNVIQYHLDSATNQFVPEVDQQGQPIIRVMETPISAVTELNDLLLNAMYAPQNAPMSFASLNIAFPVQIAKPEKNSGKMGYQVNVFPNYPLPALDTQFVLDNMEDLDTLATPSELITPEWTKRVISWVNKEPIQEEITVEDDDGFTGVPQGNPYAQPQQSIVPPTPAQPNVQGQTQPFGQANVNPDTVFGAPAGVAQPQQPTPPVQSQAPVQGQNTAGNWVPQDTPTAPQQPAQSAPVVPPTPAQPASSQVAQPQAPAQPEAPVQSDAMSSLPPDLQAAIAGAMKQ